jgi:hypothetical protein
LYGDSIVMGWHPLSIMSGRALNRRDRGLREAAGPPALFQRALRLLHATLARGDCPGPVRVSRLLAVAGGATAPKRPQRTVVLACHAPSAGSIARLLPLRGGVDHSHHNCLEYLAGRLLSLALLPDVHHTGLATMSPRRTVEKSCRWVRGCGESPRLRLRVARSAVPFCECECVKVGRHRKCALNVYGEPKIGSRFPPSAPAGSSTRPLIYLVQVTTMHAVSVASPSLTPWACGHGCRRL